jgi:hypothetical protein
MNNCYNCPYRKPCVGSTHSQCTHPIFEPPNNFMLALALLRNPTLALTTNEGTILEFNEHGVRSGWCNFPINFDPIWVSCNLPIKTE